MTIAGLTGNVRALREAKFKLGYVKKGKRYPSDSDVFVGKKADGVTPEMIAAYDAKQIPGAEEDVYSFGTRLRGMLAFSYDATTPDGREVVLELLNRSWAASRIRCSGEGGGEGDLERLAWVRDPRYMERLKKANLLIGERKGGWDARCLGPDCPLWADKATDQDKLPGCHREMRLRFVLLHPSRYDRHRPLDGQDADYLRQLGWIEVASGSWNGAIDVQSGLKVIEVLSRGRTALIPFELRRVARSVTTPEGRVIKHTLLVAHDADEVLIYATGDPGRALLRPAIRKQLIELAQAEAGQLGLGPATYADVQDIQPQPDRKALPALSEPPPHDRDDALEAAQNEAPAEPPTRLLERDELDALKVVCGGTPGQRETLGHYRLMLDRAYTKLGVPADEQGHVDASCQSWQPYPGTPEGKPVASAWATTRHADWIRAEVAKPGEEGEG